LTSLTGRYIAAKLIWFSGTHETASSPQEIFQGAVDLVLAAHDTREPPWDDGKRKCSLMIMKEARRQSHACAYSSAVPRKSLTPPQSHSPVRLLLLQVEVPVNPDVTYNLPDPACKPEASSRMPLLSVCRHVGAVPQRGNIANLQ